MTKVPVLYYSSYGHIEQMAGAVAEGARSAGAHFKTDSAHPVIEGPDALAGYDAIIVGAPTRFGQASFLDTTGGLWMRGALNGKVGAAFTSTATQHGGQEATLFSIIGPDHRRPGLRLSGPDGPDVVRGGSPYGATTVAAGDGRQPTDQEFEDARYQGRRDAETVAKLVG